MNFQQLLEDAMCYALHRLMGDCPGLPGRRLPNGWEILLMRPSKPSKRFLSTLLVLADAVGAPCAASGFRYRLERG